MSSPSVKRSSENEPAASAAGGGQSVGDQAAAVLALLPGEPVDAALSKRVLGAARDELRARHGANHRGRAQRWFGQVVMPTVLLACAAGYAYHFVKLADRIYVSHGD